ncbi:MAG: hypothetical protein ACRDL7_08090, partial [Gaiellaceae bacterium]
MPELLRPAIAAELQELQTRLQQSRKQSNQHLQHTSASSSFPWRTCELTWPDPILASDPPTLIDFLLPYFGRVKVFLPDKCCAHLLPGGKMPCKWHGYKDCVNWDCFFNPQGPRTVFDADGSVLYVLSSRYICKTRRDEEATAEV